MCVCECVCAYARMISASIVFLSSCGSRRKALTTRMHESPANPLAQAMKLPPQLYGWSRWKVIDVRIVNRTAPHVPIPVDHVHGYCVFMAFPPVGLKLLNSTYIVVCIVDVDWCPFVRFGSQLCFKCAAQCIST